jgi:putative tricarboxylic transport membrane protein
VTDRITGVVLLTFALWFGVVAWRLPTSFFSDPVGSRTFPLVIAAFLAPLAVYLMLRPTALAVAWPPRPVRPALVGALLTLIVYALLLEPLGFIPATVLAFSALALTFRAPPLRGLLAAVLTTVALYFMFGHLLELYLPAGEWLERWR